MNLSEITIEVDQRIPSKIRQIIYGKLQTIFDHDIILPELSSTTSHQFGIIDPELVIGITSLAISAVSLVLTLRQQYEEKSQWTPEKLRSAVDNELLKHGVVDAEIIAIHNYATLVDTKPGPCIIEVKIQEQAKNLKVYIFRSGNSYTLNLTP